MVLDRRIPSIWTAYTPTGTWSSNTTYTGFWRRVGDSIQVQIRLVLGGGGPDAVTLTANIPSGITIDTAKLVSSTSAQRPAFLGSSGSIFDASSGTVYLATAAYSSTTAVAYFLTDSSGTYASYTPVDASTPVTFAGSDAITLNLQAPITGWV